MADIDKKAFRDLLKSPSMEFDLVNGISEEVWIKKYPQHDNYSISINFDKGLIDYVSGATTQSIRMRGTNPDGSAVKATRKTTSNFSQSENMVVLECVNRLLTKGYEPNSIILEKSWAAGHKTSEYLDIFVMDNNNDAYAMIECKTYGKEHDKERAIMNRLNNDGQPKGQLWAYLQYEKLTKLLILYSSRYNNDTNTIDYNNDIIEIKDEWKDLNNSRERWDKWKEEAFGSFKNAGIFEEQFNLYNTKCSQVLKLSELDAETAQQLFQGFLEILRHNAISDKANAYNKILNIFMCKIIDEDEPDDKKQFWWDENTDADKFMAILEDLYKRGMDTFLNISITDYSDKDIEDLLPKSIDIKTLNEIKEAFRRQKTERSSEFAFREIYNEETFKENASIVREVVQLIQGYRFRYGHKHQFLGEFFEDLLATSIKQESGQYFTPIRIARFMCTSIPVKEETDACLKDSSKYNLPLTIDYACGSGHFLTEYMDVEQSVINDINRSQYNRAIRNELGSANNRDDDYKWASTYVYGIEKDYRLAKTTKLNTFLNGDGDANIINSDGLASFSSFDTSSALYSKTELNGLFTFVIANPPYSVEDFAITMEPESNKRFTLWQDEMGDNIECLFIERTSQLLKEGGYAAIVVPSSISFTDETFFANTRKLLFEKFRFKGIVNLSGKCFAKTDVNTQIYFLKRRPDRDAMDARSCVEGFFKNGKDFSFDGQTNVIHKYLDSYGEGISFEKYVAFIKTYTIDTSERYIKRMDDVIGTNIEKALNILKQSKHYEKADAAEAFKMKQNTIEKTTVDTIRDNEWNKLYYYLLTMTDNMIIADTLEKDRCKKFVGLTFSDRDKRGTITAKENSLINDDNLWGDKTKLNYYIYKACLGKYEAIDCALDDHARWGESSEMFDYLGEFKNKFRANVKKKIVKPLQKNFVEKRIGELLESYGPNMKVVYDNKYIMEHKGQFPVYSAATKGELVKGYIDSFDYDMEGIQISTDGVNAGTVTYREKQRFSIGPANRVYYVKESLEKTVNLIYMYYQIKQIIESAGHNWADNKCGKGKIDAYYVQLPIKVDGSIDYAEQKRIADELYIADEGIAYKQKQIEQFDKEIVIEFEKRFGNKAKQDLKNVAPLRGDRCKICSINAKDYISTENLLPNKEGMKEYTGTLENLDSVVIYSKGDILVSNIRPYLKKIWVADRDGACSADVLVFHPDYSSVTEEFIHTAMAADAFFDYMMENKNGSKMPRGDKDKIPYYKIPVASRIEQQNFSNYVQNISKNKAVLFNDIMTLKNKKRNLLERYFG